MRKQRGVHFDPRTKILLLLVINIFLLVSHSIWFEIALFGCSVLLVACGGKIKSALHTTIVFCIMLAIDRIVTPYLNGVVFTIISFIVVAIRKFLPCLVIGKWILTTTEVNEFVAAMRKIHLPQTAIIPLSVIFRYFPTIKEEWRAIRTAMKMRGIHLSIEHVMVPLLMSAINISSDISAAALCRGLDNPGKHTCLYEAKLRKADIIAFILAGLLSAAAITLKGVGLI